MKVAGMASNRGRNLLHLADTVETVEFAVVLTNQEGAPVLEAAAERGIATEVVERKTQSHSAGSSGGQDDRQASEADESRTSHEERVLARLDEYDFDLVCLDGYMRVLTENFLEHVPTTLNVHPSLLPSFPGFDAHEQVLDAGVRVTGCTVHVVDETVDGGPIVTQEPIPVFEGDDAATLKERVLYEGEFSAYPRAVRWFAEGRVDVDPEAGTVTVAGDTGGEFPARRIVAEDFAANLRYGENPHQNAALYANDGSAEATVVGAPQHNEGAKDLSYNNYNDADAALSLVAEFDSPAAAVIKHTNPAGCALATDLADAYTRALSTDPMSAFGGVVALNRECDAATAERIVDSFKEVVVAPTYTESALDVLREKEDLRVLAVGPISGRSGEAHDGRAGRNAPLDEKQLVGGRLVQQRDMQSLTSNDLDVVTEREPIEAEIKSMLFGWQTIKHVKSNAILFVTGTETVGIGMGQVSRVDAVRLAAMKAAEHAEGKDAKGAVMVSDAFFPFPDGIEHAAEAGVEAVVQPGGSVNDEEVIAAADEHGLAMAFTGMRAFRHD